MAKKIDKAQHVIAIGASAGGLEAISVFFDYTPLDSVSYILIQHLSYDYKSLMSHILERHSKLEVVEVTNNMSVECNKVYLIPSSSFMVIEDGKLLLTDKKEKQPPYKTIDHFFLSLAKERGDRAIGVILSGTGNDGSKGVAAIKEAGGFVLVQEPDSANYGEMPAAAIATGSANHVLSPEAMPQVIEDYVDIDGSKATLKFQDTEISESEMTEIIALIKDQLPLDFTDYKRPTISRRIKRRMMENHISKVNKYYLFLKSNPEEIELLAIDFLIGVTSFFRDPEAFKLIEKKVIPTLIDQLKEGDILKVWIAGCATGEEAYSLAILVEEYLTKVERKLEVKLFATDINKSALDIASKGLYTDRIEKTVSKERLRRFFTEKGTGYKINHEIRKMLVFAHHDLVKNPPYCNIDLISCRNLLIYMNAALQKKVFSMMHFGLKREGVLFLGPSESAVVVKADFDEISNKWNIWRSNKSGRAVRFDKFPAQAIEVAKSIPQELTKKQELPVAGSALADEINRALLDESGLSGVCTDKNLQVIKSFGDTSLYLKNENFNFNLNDLLPEAISITVKAAAHKALKSNKKIVLNGLTFESDDATKPSLVDAIIKPLSISRSDEKLVLILFAENKSKTTGKNAIKITDIKFLASEHLISLEKELDESRLSLEVANERIESSNENMQSFNEELLSANEEMQSANEELQSVNEELQTINKEHQITNSQLSELNDDLNNYFKSNVNGQLFVDRDLVLKKYSPAAVKHINIRETDVGRPLSNITTNIKFETIIEDIKQVILDEQTITREAESSDGRIYQVMTMPYQRKNTKKPDGAIISFFDITALKKTLSDLDKSNQSLLRINADLNNFVYGASHDLNAPLLNIESVLGILNEKMDMADPDVVNLSGMINYALTNFKDVIKDLAKVGKIESEIQDENKSENFNTIFEEIKVSISERIKTTRAIVTTDFQEQEIRFPKKNLRSILLNLLTNAIKFNSPERSPEIVISTQKVGDYVLLSVKDNGVGINKERIKFIFKMYQKINKDTEGQGIGLYLIRKIVDASGGKIEVDSEVGKGSTFNVFFKI